MYPASDESLNDRISQFLNRLHNLKISCTCEFALRYACTCTYSVRIYTTERFCILWYQKTHVQCKIGEYVYHSSAQPLFPSYAYAMYNSCIKQSICSIELRNLKYKFVRLR